MVEVHTAHTAELGTAALEAARALLDAVFEGDLIVIGVPSSSRKTS